MKKTFNKLTLKTETIKSLSADQLAGVGGGWNTSGSFTNSGSSLCVTAYQMSCVTIRPN